MPSRRACLAAIAGVATTAGGCLGRSGSRTPAEPGETPPDRTGDGTGTAAETTEPTDRARVEVTGSWTHPDADARSTLSTDTEPFETVPERLWTAGIGGDYRQVLLADDALYTATGTRLARRSLADGEPVWERSFDRGVRLGATLDDLYVTTGDDEPTLRALATAGTEPPTERWARDGVRFGRADGDLVVATADGSGRLYGLEPDGSERWSLDVGSVDLGVDVEGERFDSVALGPDHAFAAVESGGSAAWLAGVDRESGRVDWTDMGPNHAGLLTVTPDGVLSGGFYGKVFAWDHDGSDRWRAGTTPPVGRIAVADGRTFVSANTDSGPAIAALDGAGEAAWARESGTVAAVDAGAVYVLDGGVVALDPGTGERRWRLDTDVSGRVVPANGGLFVLGESALRLFG